MHERSKPPSKAPQRLTFERYLLMAWGVITVLFTLLDPAGSAGLGWPLRLLFWLLHSAGLLAMLAVLQQVLGRLRFLRDRPWWATLLAGIAGSWCFAPAALGLESLLGLEQAPDGDALDLWAARWGLAGGLMAEAAELTLPVAATWLVINLPWLLRLDFTELRPEEGPPSSGEVRNEAGGEDEVDHSAETIPPKMPPEAPPPTSGFLAELPQNLGLDLIALTSQLHYLEVHTARGRALVLYNLRDAVQDLEDQLTGLQIHRSHWVADRHVRRLVQRGRNWACELSSGLELPISRRRVAEAKARWGDAVYNTPAASAP